MNVAESDRHWMRRALTLAAAVMDLTTPNPRVGCVIVRDGHVLGEGATREAGGPHAEICALRAAAANGVDTVGSTFYVTLEPCSHHGRTPPCVEAVLAARPARVVVAMSDPNPRVNGSGLARLRAAGIEVSTGVCLEEALAQNPGFVARMTRGTPWLWLKLAGSLDGRSALHNGASQWITGAEARADGHAWRARSCVVLTGVGTVLADDPQLTARHHTTPRQPQRAIVDSRLRTPPQARILDDGNVWIFTADGDHAARRPLLERGARIIDLPGADSRVDLPAMLRWLGQNDVNEVHTEAGAVLNGALWQAGCVDEIIAYVAPMLLGDARPVVDLPALDSLPDREEFTFTEVELMGVDVRLRARRAANWAALRAAVQAQPAQRAQDG